MNFSFPNLVVFAFVVMSSLTSFISHGAESTNQLNSAEATFNRANPKMIWAGATNFIGGNPFSPGGNTLAPLSLSLRAGLDVKDGVIVLSGKPFKILYPADIHIFTDSLQAWVGVPPFNQSVILSMSDSNNVPLSKTAKGDSLGQPLTLKPKTTWFDWTANNRNPSFKVFREASYELMTIGVPQNVTGQYFKLDDPAEYFLIKSPGLYRLTIAFRLYVVDTNAYLKPLTLPPLVVPVRVE